MSKTVDINELVKRLRDGDCRDIGAAADALETMAGEVERLTLNGIHSCWEECPRLPCVQGREIRALKAERDRLKGDLSVMRLKLEAKLSTEQSEEIARLKAALEPFAKLETYRGAHDPAEGTMRMRVVTVPEIEAARKALGDAS